MNKDLSIVIPCYNEEQNIPVVLPDLVRYAAERGWKIIIVNDGSRDRSRELLTPFAASGAITLLNHKVNKGYGGAIKTGIMAADTEYIVTIDADGQHVLEDIDRLLALAIEKDADMIVGSRKGQKSASMLRGVGKSIIRLVAKISLKTTIYDINSGMKLYKAGLAQKYHSLYPDGMAFSDIITLVFLNQRHLVIEWPITIRERNAGKSTIGVKTAFETVAEILNIVVLFKPMRIFMPIAFTCIFLGIAWSIPILIHGRGVSTGGALISIIGVIIFLLGLVAEQFSAIRVSLTENSKNKE